MTPPTPTFAASASMRSPKRRRLKSEKMHVDLDLLLGVDRVKSAKFRCFFKGFAAIDLPRAWAREAAILTLTPGIGRDHLQLAFAWPFEIFEVQLPILHEFWGEEVADEARENFLSASPQDGFDWLHAMLVRKPRYNGSVPLIVTNALRDARANGVSRGQLAGQFGVDVEQVTQWWLENRFDPFTGEDLCPVSVKKPRVRRGQLPRRWRGPSFRLPPGPRLSGE